MDNTERQSARFLRSPRMVGGEWYLRGFLDGYCARWAVVPRGPAGEQYKKGYAEGVASAQRDIFAATWN